VISAGLDEAKKLQPGHGELTAGIAASLSQQFAGAHVGYKHHITEPLSVFVDGFAGVRRGVPDIGAMAGLRFEW
jgi:hypothetical protein